MDLSKKRVKKIFKALSFSLFFVLIFIAFFSWSVKDSKSQVTSCDFNNIGADNMINITSSCQITKDTLNYAFSGPSILAPIVVKTGAILTIGSQASLVLAPGQQLYVDGGQIIIDKNSDGSSGAAGIGALLRGSLYLEDSDGDNYPDSDIFVYDTGTSNTITSGETTYIKSDPANFNITPEEGIIVDCDPYDPNVFESVDCVLSEPSYGQWQNVGYCGEYVSRVQRRQRTWTKTVITEPACDGAACGTLTGIEVDDSMACGVCNPGDVTTCGEGVCTNSVTCNSQSEYPTCVENSAIYWYDNDDGDAYGDPNQRSASMSCTQPAGYIDNNYDCDDSNSSITTSGSRYRYSTSSVSCNESCASYRQTQTCSYGVWNGSYTYSNCSVNNCSSGQYCNGGTCTTCTAGYYCIGDNTRKACGSVSKYSPSGRSSCLNVSSGYYTTGGTTTTRTGQSICPAGSYCVGGIRNFCSAGTYTSTTRNTSCTSCPAGTCSGVGATSCYSDTRYYRDADGDGYGNPSNYTDSCSQPSGYVSNNGDCDDGNASVYQGSTRTRYACASVTCGTANVYETQTCQSNGTWSGSYTLTSPCSSVSSRTRYSSTQTCGSSCLSQLQTCQSTGAWTGTYTNTGCTAYSKITIYQDSDGDGYGNPSVTNSSYCSYNYPSGWATNNDDCDDSRSTIKTSYSGTMYNSYSVSCGDACASRTRTCSNGVWDSYTNYDQYSCTASTRKRYSASQVCGTSCSSQTQTCQTNGAWSGTYTSTGCTSYSKITIYQDSDGDGYGNPSVTNTNYCSYNYPSGWKTNNDDCDDSSSTIKTIYSRTMYNSSSVACGTACASRTRTCSNGVWDSYTNYDQYSCTASTRTRYSASQVCGTSCSSQTQTCQTNGAWSGTYTSTGCTSYSKITVYQDSDGDGYGNSSVTNTNYCSYNYPSGWRANNDDCDDNNSSIKPGSTRTRYQNSSPACLNSCVSETQTCSNGSWSGTYQYSSCSTTTCSAGTYCSDGSCTTCTSGYRCPGNNYRYICPAGSYSSSGSSSCTACQNGSYTSSSGSKTCTICLNYAYNIGTGNTSCPHCKANSIDGFEFSNILDGQSANATRDACYRSNGGQIINKVSCSNGVASLDTHTDTPTCYSGYVYYRGAWDSVDCIHNCLLATCSGSVTSSSGKTYDVGTMNHNTTATKYSSSSTYNCSASIQCSDGSLSVLSESCSCASGTYGTYPSCTTCPTRSYCTSGTRFYCPTGYTSPSGSDSSSDCFTCPAGYYSSNHYSCGLVGSGYYSPANTYQRYYCTSGDYCSGSYTSSPTPCPAGTYNPNTRATSVAYCQTCPAGTYSYAGYSSCSSCSSGYTSPAGSNSSSDCFTCNGGYYSSNNSTCISSGRGYYSPASDYRRYSCPRGTYQPYYNVYSESGCKFPTGDYYVDFADYQQCKRSCPGQTSNPAFQHCMTSHHEAPYSCYAYCYNVSGTTCIYN